MIKKAIISCFIVVTFANIAKANDNLRQNYYDETVDLFEPLPPPEKYLDRKAANMRAQQHHAQYQGDHSFLWYKKNDKKGKLYIAFDINYSFLTDIDNLTVNNVEYPDATASNNGALNYKGAIDGSGALGMNMAFGYQRGQNLRFELEMTFNRLHFSKITPNGFTNLSLDSGNYIESGPEVIEDDNDILKALAGTGNIVLNLRGDKKIVPYIGGGMGYGMVGVSSEYDIYPVYQMKAGILIKLNEKIQFVVGGKHLVYDDVTYQYKVSKENSSNVNYNDRIYKMTHSLEVSEISIGYKFTF